MKGKYYPKESRLEYLPPARQANPQGARVLGETSSDQECSTCNLAGRWFWQEKKRNPREQPLLLGPRSVSPHGGDKWRLTKTNTGTAHSEPSIKLAKATQISETRRIPGISITHNTVSLQMHPFLHESHQKDIHRGKRNTQTNRKYALFFLLYLNRTK